MTWLIEFCIADKLVYDADLFGVYFVRSGGVWLYGSSLKAFGYNDNIWSNTAIDYGSDLWDSIAHVLFFNASGVAPSNGGNRYYGFPVRCLV